MNNVYIQYNPYKLETIIKIEDEFVKENSILNVGKKRLQEWIDKLPEFLQDECNEKKFDLTFMGTKIDFEDVQEVVRNAEQKGIEINLIHVPVQEVENMELEIEEVFDEIIHGPIDELKTEDLKAAFSQALKDEFEITVVATMSAGKSTLINALLQKKIMPSSQEACTATVSRIKDTDDEVFSAIAYSADGEELKYLNDVQLKDMSALNENERVSLIQLEGNIPFTYSDETSLVLVDTPGPNNSRDKNHLKMTHDKLSDSSKTLILYILNATQLGVNDDSKLLDTVAESMKVGGKQSKDRYLFVINKLDQFRTGEDDVERSLTKVRKYLADRGIEDPHIFPAAALTALNIREMLNRPEAIDEELEDEIRMSARKLNRSNQLHLEKFSTLPPSLHQNISDQLVEIEDGDKENLHTALIHSGIPVIEEMIKLYVGKYAKTAKVKNIVDTFQKKLESSRVFESVKNDIINQKENHDLIKEQIQHISQKLITGDESKIFKDKIETLNPLREIKAFSNKLHIDQNKSINELMNGKINKLYTIEEVETEAEYIVEQGIYIHSKLVSKLNNYVNDNLNKVATQLIEEYQSKILSLVDGIENQTIAFEPYKLIASELNINPTIIQYVRDSIEYIDVKVGTESYENPEREGFWGFFKFYEPKLLSRDVYEKQARVEGTVLSDIVSKIELSTRKEINNIEKNAEAVVKKLKFAYKRKFEEVDQILLKKMKELEVFTKNAQEIQFLIEESYSKLMWLKNIEMKVNGILELEAIEMEEEIHDDYATI